MLFFLGCSLGFLERVLHELTWNLVWRPRWPKMWKNFPASGSWVLGFQPCPTFGLQYSPFLVVSPLHWLSWSHPFCRHFNYSGFKPYIFIWFNPIFWLWLPSANFLHIATNIQVEQSLGSSDFPAQPSRLEIQCFLSYPSLSWYSQPVCLHWEERGASPIYWHTLFQLLRRPAWSV